MDKSCYSKEGGVMLKDIIVEIMSTEQLIKQERTDLENQLKQIKNNNIKALKNRETELEQELYDELKTYEDNQQKLLDDCMKGSQNWKQEKSSQLARSFETNEDSVVDALLKEVETIYGHF